MAITFKTAAKTKVKQAESQKTKIQELVDRIGEVDVLLKDVKELIAEKEKLRKSLLEQIADHPSDEEVVLHGEDFTVTFSPAAKSRKITDMEGYFNAVGEEIFLKTVEVPITRAEKLLSPQELEKIMTVTAGSRTLKAITSK